MKALACALLGAVLCSPLKLQAIETSAKSAALYCPQTQQFIYEKNDREKMGCASTTKILTALVVIENMDPAQIVSIPSEACGIEGSSLYLQAGEQLSVRDLLYALMLRSANDCAAALAIACSGSIEAFTQKMNELASSIGALDSHFENPHGLDGDEHYTTAHDLALIAAKALENPLFCDIVSTKSYTVDAPEGKRVLTNHNKLLWRY
ncbi:MAG: D-alanyl-D-alanine carboxypeptidase, partial [Clostridia bacterium]|nr:D-alanyl-D-alanine carboxypeptidase [Clostridia bacterium]